MRHVFMTMILLLSNSLSVVAIAAPDLTVDQPVFDFGTIAQGKKVEHVFILKNKGTTPLTIKNTSTSCGCTAANVSSSVIQPGKSAEIKTTFDSSNFTGKVTKTVSVETDAPQNPVRTLTLKGTIVEEVIISPRQINLGKIKAGEKKEITLTVENKGSKKLHLIDVKTSLPQVTSSVSKSVIPPGGTATILVTATTRDGDRFLSGYLSLKTSNPHKSIITIPFYGSVGN